MSPVTLDVTLEGQGEGLEGAGTDQATAPSRT